MKIFKTITVMSMFILWTACDRTEETIILSFKNIEIGSHKDYVYKRINKADFEITNITDGEDYTHYGAETSLITAYDDAVNVWCGFSFKNDSLETLLIEVKNHLNPRLIKGIIELYEDKYGRPKHTYEENESEKHEWIWKNQKIVISRLFSDENVDMGRLYITYKDRTEEIKQKQFYDSIKSSIEDIEKDKKEVEESIKKTNKKIRNNQDI